MVKGNDGKENLTFNFVFNNMKSCAHGLMADKLIATIRFNTEGVESDLYRKILEGRDKAGLSVPEYVKKILFEHFEAEEKCEKERSVLYEIREEYQGMARRLEKAVSQSIQRHDAVLLEAITKMGGISSPQTDVLLGEQVDAKIPEVSGEVPEGALDFLNW